MTTAVHFPTFIARPRPKTGVWSWITTVDHRRIGTLYGVTAFIFFPRSAGQRDDFWYQKHPELIHEEGHDADTEGQPPGHITGGADLPAEVAHASERPGHEPDQPRQAPGAGAYAAYEEAHGIHTPDKSYYPILVAAGIAFGIGTLLVQEPVLIRWLLPALGFGLAFWSAVGWAIEPVNEVPDEH